MAQLKIVHFPDPVLTRKAEKLTDFGPETQKLFDDMTETMYFADGAGLAAPQVGVSRQILIASPKGRRGDEIVVVNPEIYEFSGSEIGPEGCLSFPGLAVDVARATRIKVRYQDRDGNAVDAEFKNFFARVIQHEMDHLNGILMIDKVDFLQRQKLLAEYQSA